MFQEQQLMLYDSMEELLTKISEIEARDLLKSRLAMGGEDWSKIESLQ